MKTVALLCLLFGLSWCTPVEREKRRVFEQTCLTSADCDAFNHECVIRDGDGYGQCVTTSRSKFSTDVETHSEDTSYISVPANVRPQDIESVVRNKLDRNNNRKKRSPHDGKTELSPDKDPHGPSGIETDVDDPEHVRHSKVDLMAAHPLCTGDKCKTDDDKSDEDHTVEKRSAKSSVLQNLESYSPDFAEQKDFENVVAPANVGSVLNKKDQATFDNRVKKRDVEDDDDDEEDGDDDDEEDDDDDGDDDDDIGSDDERGPDDSDEDEDDSDDVEDVKVEPKKGGFTDYISELFRGKRDNKNVVSNSNAKLTKRDTGNFDIEELLDELNGKSDEDDSEKDDDDYYYDDNDDDYETGGDDDYGDDEEGLERKKRFSLFGNEDDNEDDDYNDDDDYDEDDYDEDDDEDDDYEYDDNDNEVKEELNESELLSLLSRKRRGSYDDYAGDDDDEDNDDDDNDDYDNEGDGDDYDDDDTENDDKKEDLEDEEYDNVEKEDGDYDDEKDDSDEDEEQKLADLIGMLSREKRSVSNTHDKTLSVAKRTYDDYVYEEDDNDNDEEYNDDDDDEDYDDGKENDEGDDYDQNGYADVEDESELLSLLSRKKRNVDNDYDEDEDDYDDDDDDYDEENDEYDDEEDDDNDDDDEETGGFNPIDDSELLALLTRGQRKKRGLRNYDDDNYFDSNVEDSYNLKPFPVPLPVSHRRKMGHRPPAVPIAPGLNWTKVSTGPEPSTNRNNTRQSKRAVAAGGFPVKKNDMYNRANEDVDDTDEILIDSDFLDDHTSTDTGVETKTGQLGKSDAVPREKRDLGYRPEDESGGENGLVKEAKAFEEIDGDPNSGYGKWSKWSACSQTCGVGIKQRTRKCRDPTNCYSGDSEMTPCILHPC